MNEKKDISTEIHDKKHIFLMKGLLGLIKRPIECRLWKSDLIEVDIEVPFNYFGSRGFIDILLTNSRESAYWFFEIKSSFQDIDIGETIRQIKGYAEFYPKVTKKEHYQKVLTLIADWNKSNVDFMCSYIGLFRQANIDMFLVHFNKKMKVVNLAGMGAFYGVVERSCKCQYILRELRYNAAEERYNALPEEGRPEFWIWASNQDL
jgi:hypothetical protein